MSGTALNLGILSRDSRLYSTKRLIEEARKSGHKVRVFDPLRCYMGISKGKPVIRYKGAALKKLDAVIPRIGSSITYYGCSLVRQFELAGIYTLNSAESILRARDKICAMQMLSQHGIALPETSFAQSPDDTQDMISLCGGAPLVIKVNDGSQGRGVVLAENDITAEALINAFRSQWVYIFSQKFISEAKGRDIRCFVVGDKVVAAMERIATDGDFRANIHRGAIAREVALTDEEQLIAVKSANILGLTVSGVDLIRSEKGPLVLEVNASPGLEGIEKFTGVNVARIIIEKIESAKSNS